MCNVLELPKIDKKKNFLVYRTVTLKQEISLLFKLEAYKCTEDSQESWCQWLSNEQGGLGFGFFKAQL